MKRVCAQDLEKFCADDSILRRLDACDPVYETLTCQQWLRNTPAKRYIFETLYGDLLQSGGKHILDVGGGLTGFTPVLASQHEYTLVELMAHDAVAAAETIRAVVGKEFIVIKDWYEFEPATYDVVIANDLFPNVDQRIGLFLQKMLPVTKEIRLSLTYYDTPRFYNAKRVNADEFLCVLAWNGKALKSCLEEFASCIVDADMDCIGSEGDSVYPNGRQVCLVTMRGALAS